MTVSRCLVPLLLAIPITARAQFPTFEHQEIDPHVGNVCYALTLADVNGDEKTDIVAVAEKAVVWYENPSWEKHTILEGQTIPDNVCIAPYDIDRDGRIDFALGAGWTKVGTIQWLGRAQGSESWEMYPIGEERWLHRMRWGDVLGTGRAQLVISPLNRTVGDGVRLTAFEIPVHPRADAWKPIVIDDSLDRMHNHWMVDFDGDGIDDVLAASEQGVYLFHSRGSGTWEKMRLGTGNPGTGDDPTGAGDIKIGTLASGTRFIATVEPMHGTQAVVYTPPDQTGQLWSRHVLDDSLKQGHLVWLADLDRDGSDEIIIGHREAGNGPVKGPGLYVFDADDDSGTTWTKHVLDDGGVAVEDAVAADFDGDGWIDIVAGGRATHNVKLYWNRGTAK
jgi:hypothetical protein